MPHLSASTTAGDLVFLSGQVAFDASGQIVGDIAAQTLVCLEGLERELGVRGLDRAAVVKTSVWLTDRADFAGFDAAYAAFFGDHKPARSTVISGLAVAGARVEIDAIAAAPPTGNPR